MNQNGKLNAARLAEMSAQNGAMSQSQRPSGQPKTLTAPPMNVAKRVVSAAAGASVGMAGSVGGLLGSDPQRNSVPANQYGKENPSFGRAYNIASTPGSLVAKAYKKIGKAL